MSVKRYNATSGSWETYAGLGAVTLKQTDEYTDPGTYTWTKPTSFTVSHVEVFVTGAGGGGAGGERSQNSPGPPGAGGGGGGGAGAVAYQRLSGNILPASISLRVGAGGQKGNSASANNTGSDGADGESSFFGPIIANGGAGGQSGGYSTSASVSGGRGGLGGAGILLNTPITGNANFPANASAFKIVGGSVPLAFELGWSGSARSSANVGGATPINTTSWMPSPGGSGGSSQGGKVSQPYGGATAASADASASIAGGATGSSSFTSSGSVSASGTHGGSGSISPAFPFFGSGGGGGGSASAPGGGSATYLGGNGGDGVRGGGGGGGGALALTNAPVSGFRSVSGSGGMGGNGYVVVYTYGY